MPPDLLLYTAPSPFSIYIYIFLDLPLLTYTCKHHGVIQSAEHVSDCPIRDYGLVNPFQLTRPEANQLCILELLKCLPIMPKFMPLMPIFPTL